MIERDTDLSARARDWRRSFDDGFAVRRKPSAAPGEDLLFALVNGRRYAMRVAELRGVHPARRIMPIPSVDRALLGIVGIRGQLIAAYDVGALLGFTDGHGDHGWLVTCGSSDVVIALAFERFVGSARVAASDLYVPDGSEGLPTHVARVARTPAGTACVIDIGSIIESVTGMRDRGAGSQGDRSSTHANEAGR